MKITRPGRPPFHTSCTVTQRVRTEHFSLMLATGETHPTGAVWSTRECGTPLFTDREHRTGICASCRAGWRHPHRYPLATAAELLAPGVTFARVHLGAPVCPDCGSAGELVVIGTTYRYREAGEQLGGWQCPNCGDEGERPRLRGGDPLIIEPPPVMTHAEAKRLA